MGGFFKGLYKIFPGKCIGVESNKIVGICRLSKGEIIGCSEALVFLQLMDGERWVGRQLV